jgi:hypothetical protein
MDLTLRCPNCNDTFIVNTKDLNCGVFRHAVYKSTMLPINPHESKENCEKLFATNQIYGCGKPFKIVLSPADVYETLKCDYI